MSLRIRLGGERVASASGVTLGLFGESFNIAVKCNMKGCEALSD